MLPTEVWAGVRQSSYDTAAESMPQHRAEAPATIAAHGKILRWALC
jgi:hypothetical protein